MNVTDLVPETLKQVRPTDLLAARERFGPVHINCGCHKPALPSSSRRARAIQRAIVEIALRATADRN